MGNSDEQFTIHSWGNLTGIAPYGQKSTSESLNQSVLANNQAIGVGYDSDGNQTGSTDPWNVPHTYSYDAENRMTAVDNGGTATYVYDGDGNRVLKKVGGAGTIYWYGSGNVLGESDLTGT